MLILILLSMVISVHAGISTHNIINPIALFTFSNSSDWLAGSNQMITLTVNQHFRKNFVLKSLTLVSESGSEYTVCKNVDAQQVNIACDLGPFCVTTQCSFTVPSDMADDPLIAKAHWGDCDKVIVLGPLFCSNEAEESSDAIVNILSREPIANVEVLIPSPSITSVVMETLSLSSTILTTSSTASVVSSTTFTSSSTTIEKSSTTSILVSPTAESLTSSSDNDTTFQSLIILGSIIVGITVMFIGMVLWFKRKQALEDRMLRNQEISQMLPESFPQSRPAESPFIPRPSAYYIPENVLVQPSESYMPLYSHYPSMENHSMNNHHYQPYE